MPVGICCCPNLAGFFNPLFISGHTPSKSQPKKGNQRIYTNMVLPLAFCNTKGQSVIGILISRGTVTVTYIPIDPALRNKFVRFGLVTKFRCLKITTDSVISRTTKTPGPCGILLHIFVISLKLNLFSLIN